MRRKLIWLNVALAGLIGAAAWKLQGEWVAQKQAEEQISRVKITPPPVPVVVIPAAPAPVVAASYSDIANKMLFSKERNPNVVVEVVVEKPKPPMPPLPILHGVMGLPSGMLALLSPDAKAPSKGVKVGDKVGEFQLAALTRDEISFEWQDKTVTKSVSEMIYKGLETAAEKAPPASAPPGASSAAAPASAPAPTGSGKPGVESVGQEDVKTCIPGDNSPNGTISDGYKKVLMPTPFGNACHWEKVK